MHAQRSTDRLLLSPLSREHAAACLALFNSPGWLDFIGDRGIANIEQAEQALIENAEKCWKTHGYGSYHLTLKDGTPVGNTGLVKRPELDQPDFGFALLPAFEGRGYAREASEAILQQLDESFDFPYLWAIALERNTRSNRLLKHLEFTPEGIITMGAEELVKWKREKH